MWRGTKWPEVPRSPTYRAGLQMLHPTDYGSYGTMTQTLLDS